MLGAARDLITQTNYSEAESDWEQHKLGDLQNECGLDGDQSALRTVVDAPKSAIDPTK